MPSVCMFVQWGVRYNWVGFVQPKAQWPFLQQRGNKYFQYLFKFSCYFLSFFQFLSGFPLQEKEFSLSRHEKVTNICNTLFHVFFYLFPKCTSKRKNLSFLGIKCFHPISKGVLQFLLLFGRKFQGMHIFCWFLSLES